MKKKPKKKQMPHVWKITKKQTLEYHTVWTIPKSSRKTVERGKIDTSNTHIHGRLHS
jgi:hypothetical protein